MLEITTDQALLNQIEQARYYSLSKKEIEAQRISYIKSIVGDKVSVEDICRILRYEV